MAYVLDPSVAAAWFLPDEFSDLADRLLDRLSNDAPIIPSLFRHELRNVLLVAERRSRITARDVDEALKFLATLPLVERGAGDDQTVVDLARRHRLSSYDAAYLALALTDRLPLATFDKKLASAAHAEQVKLIGAL